MEIELYEVENGYGFRVGGVVQDYDPDQPGFVVMTKARAQEAAEAVAERLRGKTDDENLG